ncbi:MAG: DUF4175 family protein, partial [Alphaproteobacteria bacterium]
MTSPWRLSRNRRALAWLALAWEALWPALWQPSALAGLFLALALLGAWEAVPGWLHAAALAGFAAATLSALARGLRHVRLPDHGRVRRRLERASGVPHRPLTALEDDLASGGGDPLGRALWRAHR